MHKVDLALSKACRVKQGVVVEVHDVVEYGLFLKLWKKVPLVCQQRLLGSVIALDSGSRGEAGSLAADV
jgi:hypothetical protein